MKLVTQQQIREMDRRTIAAGVPSLTLMERAGRGLLRSLRAHAPDLSARPLWILCGKGNNGGDGLVLARLLAQEGMHPRVILFADRDSLSGDAALNASRAEAAGVLLREPSGNDREALVRLGSEAIVVDALLGTGITGPARGVMAEWIEALGHSSASVMAVDVPSGVSADGPGDTGPQVRADWTTTMAWPKRSFLFPPVRERAGAVEVVDIGISAEISAQVGWDAEVLTPLQARDWLPSGHDRDHKGRWGKLVIAGGAPGMVGAPIFAARAALRCGSGLVRVALPARLAPIVHSSCLEAMTLPMPEGEEGQMLAAGAESLVGRLGSWDALVIGPGIGRFADTDRFVLRLLGAWSRPMVVDADALNVLASWGPDSWVPRARDIRAAGEPGGVVLTPHAGELSRLTGETVPALMSDPIATARQWSSRWGVTLVAKGAPSVIAAPDGRVWVNPTGNSGLATGGSGDVLAGILGALLGQGMSGPQAATLGCYLHGLAADLWASSPERAQRSLLPGDVVETLPQAIACVERGEHPPRWRWSSI